MKYLRVIGVVAGLLFCMLLGSAAAEDTSFKDVPVTHWAYGSVQALSKAGIVKGFPDGTFRPDLKVSREQFAIVLVRTLEIPLNERASQIFSDIKPDHRSFSYIDAAKSFIPVPSNLQGKFNFQPDRAITREEVAEALVLSMDLKGAGSVSLQRMFSDYKNISPEFRERVAAAVYNKVLSGKPDGTFDPKGSLTRAQLCTVMNKILEDKAKQEEARKRQKNPEKPTPPPQHHEPWTIEFNFEQPNVELVHSFYGTVVSKIYNADDSYMVLENTIIENETSRTRLVTKSVNMCVYESDLNWFFIGDAVVVDYDRNNRITSYKVETAAAPHSYLPPVGGTDRAASKVNK